MSKRCKLQKEFHKEIGNYKGVGKYSDSYVKWLEDKILSKKQGENLLIQNVSNCLPTEEEWFELRDKITDEHMERLSRQTKFFNLRAGIEKGMDSIIDRIKAYCC